MLERGSGQQKSWTPNPCEPASSTAHAPHGLGEARAEVEECTEGEDVVESDD